jgi:bacterioferritin (cytochrome b1)
MEETYESYSDLSDEEKEHAGMLKDKLRDIKKAAKKKYTRAELEECEGFEALQEKM